MRSAAGTNRSVHANARAGRFGGGVTAAFRTALAVAVFAAAAGGAAAATAADVLGCSLEVIVDPALYSELRDNRFRCAAATTLVKVLKPFDCPSNNFLYQYNNK